MEENFIRKLPTLILASPFTEEEKIFFFFYIFRAEGEFHYAKQTQWTSWITNKCSSSSTLSECKGSFIRKSLPAQILASPLTEEEIIFVFFYILRLEREFHYAKQTQSTSWITNYNSLTDVEEELFFFFCMLRMKGEFYYKRKMNILLLLHSQSAGGDSLENLFPPWY